MSEPSMPTATEPTMPPPFVFHDETGLFSAARSIAQIAFAASPQRLLVPVYSDVLTATGSDQFALGGRNAAGFWMSLPDGLPSTWRTPSLAITYTTPDGRPNPPLGPPAGAPGIPGVPAAAPRPPPPPGAGGCP